MIGKFSENQEIFWYRKGKKWTEENTDMLCIEDMKCLEGSTNILCVIDIDESNKPVCDDT